MNLSIQKNITFCGLATMTAKVDYYLMLRDIDWKKSAGVPMRDFVRRATAGVKCFMLCVSSQSGRLATADSKTGRSAPCRMRCLEDYSSASSG